MAKNTEKVAVVKCNSYKQNEVDEAVEKALSLIDFKFRDNMKVLIKPNVVGCFPKKQIATTTHPSIIEAICKILKKNDCKIFIGDSPFTNPELSFRASGIDKVAKKYGKLIIFEQDKLVKIRDKKAKVLKSFEISKNVRDADLIINIPKLKTHSLTKYTGAVKNLYGIIPGGLKQRLHNKAHGDKKFSDILVDIYQNIKPGLTIMDGVIGMEGEGPTSGDAKKVGLILASKNGIALDIAVTKMIGINPKSIYAIKECLKRKLYPNFKFQIIGEKFKKIEFKLPGSHSKSRTKKLLKMLFREKPIICDTKKCIRCGLCMKHCPGKAIGMNPFPVVERGKCIRCFCCIEICPQDAMMLKQN
jgi:uncharacterized protein (DUF362 family)